MARVSLRSTPARARSPCRAGGSITRTPGATTVTVKAADLLGASATATLTVDVEDVNEPPTAVDLWVRVLEDETVDIDVVGRASDQDAGDTLTVAGVVSSPGKGRTTVNDVTNNITYTPQANYHGADSFTYRVNDAKTLLSNTATVTITVDAVNDAPEFRESMRRSRAPCRRSASESDERRRAGGRHGHRQHHAHVPPLGRRRVVRDRPRQRPDHGRRFRHLGRAGHLRGHGRGRRRQRRGQCQGDAST